MAVFGDDRWRYREAKGNSVAIDDPQQEFATIDKFRLLNEEEMKQLFNNYNDLMNASFEKRCGISDKYDTDDLLYIDSWWLTH